ncbi:B-cell receptor-associated protein 31 [Galendromus occidentalis]|uniref:Endoplasmic reticulum transmembrane protein n=1 Tax=Galendromus occidentalis TaxID=34638 RepID=A0AAJ6QWD5_9ACAR|nr:B-cell receptor-associated protein 31 [Galendromus occidentalis]XP_003746020.1 B-cell receptor-associated protein 31 [Galendromus occidentalis]
MSIQWTLIAAFLYGEIAVVLLLIIPFISPKMWNYFFKSRFLRSLAAQSNTYFTVIIGILTLFFIDSLREMARYSSLRHHEIEHSHLDAEMQQSMKMFRAQRNFYIAGFALFLWMVIRRLVTLISFQANLMASNEATLKQAQNAAAAASRAMDGGTNSSNEIKELEEQLEKQSKELAKAIKDRDAMKTQSENLAKQYDDLCNLHAKCADASGSRKDD